jgi:hypothetical protein
MKAIHHLRRFWHGRALRALRADWRTVRNAAGLALAAVLLMAAAPAVAQLRLPSASLPTLGRLPQTNLPGTLQQAVPLQDLRLSAQRDLVRRNPDRIELDPAGQAVRRSELIWLAPTATALNAAREQGFTLLREQLLEELELRQVVLRAPQGDSLATAAQRLRAIEPEAAVDFNHLYWRSGTVAAESPARAASSPERAARRRIGLIDGGVDRRHPAFEQARVIASGCDGREVPSRHGTAVASLLVGHDGAFSGVQPTAVLIAADVYCDAPDGGAAEDVARALAWMVRERVPVINVSLVGPPNALLEQATQAVIRRGHLIVAAVGNDGPAAPRLYPASYAGVVGVSGVTPRRSALPEAAQGPQVHVAAPGSEVAVASAGGGYASARGTSFAAPIVAGLLADALPEPGAKAAAAALLLLERSATDLGAAGRDDVFGFGLVGESARTAPERVSARRW